MNKQITAIANRIKDLREFSDFSTSELAKMVGIPEQDYIELESGDIDIPIGTLYNIAAALQIDPTVLLTGENSMHEEVSVVYKGQGMDVSRYEGYSFSSLAYNYFGREMEPMLVTLKSGIAPELVKHTGQEFNYVLDGELRVLIGSKEYYLRAGDCIYFNPTIAHAQVSMTETSTFLTVILEK